MEQMDLNLHHVGLLVKNIPEMAALYQQLGYRERTGIIHDPIQTAYVQFFQIAGDRVYVELVTPDGDESKLANALRKGGGLNHVCYSTAAIEKTSDELCAAGFFVVSPPDPEQLSTAAALPGSEGLTAR